MLDQELKEEILKTADLDRLYEIQIDLNSDISIVQQRIFDAINSTIKRTEITRIKLYQSMLEICVHRISDLKQKQAEEKDLGNKLNYHFRIAARTNLKPETYNKLNEIAQLPINEIKIGRFTNIKLE